MLKNMISLAECCDGGLYRLRSRNLQLGIFNKSDDSFTGIRTKLSERFLDSEKHYEVGVPFGTAIPTEFLEVSPPGLLPSEVFIWLEDREKFYLPAEKRK